MQLLNWMGNQNKQTEPKLNKNQMVYSVSSIYTSKTAFKSTEYWRRRKKKTRSILDEKWGFKGDSYHPLIRLLRNSWVQHAVYMSTYPNLRLFVDAGMLGLAPRLNLHLCPVPPKAEESQSSPYVFSKTLILTTNPAFCLLSRISIFLTPFHDAL